MKTISIEKMKSLMTLSAEIEFVIKNKLIGMDLSRLDEIIGDHKLSCNGGLIQIFKDNYNNLYEYDQNGKIIKVQTDNKAITEFKYDDKGNMIFVRMPSGTEEWYDYDEHGNMIRSGGNYNNGTVYKYNKDNKLTEMIRGSRIRYDCIYDTDGNLFETVSTIKQNNGADGLKEYETSTFWVYNEKRQIISAFEPVTNKHKWFKYDQNGNVIYEKVNDKITTHESEFYPNGQLKRFDNLFIPFMIAESH